MQISERRVAKKETEIKQGKKRGRKGSARLVNLSTKQDPGTGFLSADLRLTPHWNVLNPCCHPRDRSQLPHSWNTTIKPETPSFQSWFDLFGFYIDIDVSIYIKSRPASGNFMIRLMWWFHCCLLVGLRCYLRLIVCHSFVERNRPWNGNPGTSVLIVSLPPPSSSFSSTPN